MRKISGSGCNQLGTSELFTAGQSNSGQFAEPFLHQVHVQPRNLSSSPSGISCAREAAASAFSGSLSSITVGCAHVPHTVEIIERVEQEVAAPQRRDFPCACASWSQPAIASFRLPRSGSARIL
jgi:hypothetical protein